MAVQRVKARSDLSLAFQKGEEAYVDSGFLLRCFIDESSISVPTERKPDYKLAKQLLINLAREKVPIMISPLAFDEIWYTYIRLLYQKEKGREAWNGRTLKDNPGIVSTYKSKLEELQKKILKYPHLRVIGVSHESIKLAFDNMLNYELAPRDSFHFASCCVENAGIFITGDRDYRAIPEDYDGIRLRIIEF
jgi:predicted nucleic acid-binding protein